VQLAELAVVPAVEKINNKPDQQPNDKAKPGFAGSAQHQKSSGEGAKGSNVKDKRRLEGALEFGM
jgi:hypothetical protein